MNNYKLKRLFKKVLFFLIITIILWFIKLSFVSAATIEPSYYKFAGIESFPNVVWANPGNNRFILTVNSAPLNVAPLEEQNFIVLTACISANNNSYSVTNDSLNGAIANGSVDYLDTRVSCKIDSYDGTFYKFYFKVYKWAVPSGGADVYQVSSYFNINNPYSYGNVWSLYSLFILDKSSYLDDSVLVSQNKGQDTIISQNNTIINNGNATNQKLDDLNKNITDDTPPDFDGLKNSAGWLPKGPVDSIINLPLSLLENIQDNLGKTCQPVSLPLPFVNKNIDLPCINTIYSQIEGMNSFFNWCGVVASVFILFRYLMYLYNRVDSTLTLRENTLPGYFEDSMWGGM